MNAPAAEANLLPRIAKTFRRVFGPRVAFHQGLDRTSESRWTSLKHVELLIALEVEFGVRFDGADATDLTSVERICERIAARLATAR